MPNLQRNRTTAAKGGVSLRLSSLLSASALVAVLLATLRYNPPIRAIPPPGGAPTKQDTSLEQRSAALAALAACLSANGSQLVRPGDAEFNTLVNRSFRSDAATPHAFVQPASEGDVQTAVRCARAAQTRVCARSGGHAFSGSGLCAGLVVDLSRLSRTRFAREAGRGGGADDVLVGPAATLGDLLAYVHGRRARWFAAGVCPGVGVAGYVLGGGHGPYDGELGLGCDALREFRMVDRAGRVVVASRTSHALLFWAGCGAGAGHFGIVTRLRLRTAPARPFDNAVAFVLSWPLARAGALLAALTRSRLRVARVWARAEIVWARRGSASSVLVYGACFDVAETDTANGACLLRLHELAFFQTPDMQVRAMVRTRNALSLHAFVQKAAAGGGNQSAAAVAAALTGRQYVDGGLGNAMTIHAAFVKMGRWAGRRRRERAWQAFAEACRVDDGSSVRFLGCQVNAFQLRRADDADDERLAAFAHRDAEALTFSFMTGGERADREAVYERLRDVVRPFVSGMYVNYPQTQLGRTEFARLYWGDRLHGLQQVKRDWDRESFFMQQQPLPM